jgi:hypothetical protein
MAVKQSVPLSETHNAMLPGVLSLKFIEKFDTSKSGLRGKVLSSEIRQPHVLGLTANARRGYELGGFPLAVSASILPYRRRIK